MLRDCGISWLHYENTPIQIIYIENFTTKKGKFSDKKF